MIMEKQLIDDCFYVSQKKYGLWDSYDKDGKGIVTALTEEECVKATRFMLKLKQENKLNGIENTYSGTVDGKL
jgi:hypothetical protein